jgi:hypothetical protein
MQAYNIIRDDWLKKNSTENSTPKIRERGIKENGRVGEFMYDIFDTL